MTFPRSGLLATAVIAGLVVVLVAPLLSVPSYAQSDQQLDATYAPELHFTKGELFYPTSVDYLISSSTLMQRTGGQPILVDASPTPSDLGSGNSTEFLNNKLGTEAAIAADYATNGESLGYYAYVHVVHQNNGTVIQYWLFYAYNNGPLNDHQGDLEVIQVFLSPSGSPQTLLLSQHFAGENAAWSDVETTGGTHPVVYVAQGSHANYFRSYQGKIGIENDVVGNDGMVITPDKLNLVILGEQGNHPANQSWLDFPGRWGYWGTDLEVAQGKAGPLGPVFNQGGVRWASPQAYLAQTFPVSGYYFDLAFVAANFLLIFVAYTGIRAVWKIVGIVRRSRRGTLAARRLLRGRLAVGVTIVVVGVLITVGALFLPWYTISSSSQTGPLGSLGKVELLHLDGISGLAVNFFNGGSSDASSGFSPLLSTQIPFSIIIAAGIVLLVLDLVGFRSGGRLGRKFLLGAISSLVPFILIFIFVSQLSLLLPSASQLLPGQTVPQGVDTLVQAVAANPVGGTASQTFPIVGVTTVEWGFGLGAYLFVLAAVLRMVGAFVVWGVKEEAPAAQSESPSTAQPNLAAQVRLFGATTTSEA